MRNVAIHVEGYHDRAFLSGWLLHRGWSDPGQRPVGRKQVRNPITKEFVTSGRFGFHSPNGSTFVEVVPNHGDERLLDELGRQATRVVPPDPDEMVVVLDVDDPNLADGSTRRGQSLHDRLVRSDPGTSREGYVWTLSSGAVVRLALWACETDDCRGVPDAHTLERVVSAAIARTHPERAIAVQAWLDGRPAPPPRSSAKEHSWSYMAGWYADRGCDAFLTSLWSDARIAAALDELLATSTLDAILRNFE